jgi:hypothetical protein
MTPHLEACICFALLCWGCAGVGFAFNQIAESQTWRAGGDDDDTDSEDDGESWKNSDKTKKT